MPSLSFKIKEGPIVKPINALQLKPKKQHWCSACTRNGHLEHNCAYITRTHPPVLPYPVEYVDLYDTPLQLEQHYIQEQGIPCPDNGNEPPVQTNEVVDAQGTKNSINTSMNVLLTKNQVCFLEQNKNYLEYLSRVFKLPLKIKPGLSSFAVIKIYGQSGTVQAVNTHLNEFLNTQQVVVSNMLIKDIKRYLKKMDARNKDFHKPEKILKRLPRSNSQKSRFYFQKLNFIIFGLYRAKDANKYITILCRYKTLSLKQKIDMLVFDEIIEALDYLHMRVRPLHEYKQLLEGIMNSNENVNIPTINSPKLNQDVNVEINLPTNVRTFAHLQTVIQAEELRKQIEQKMVILKFNKRKSHSSIKIIGKLSVVQSIRPLIESFITLLHKSYFMSFDLNSMKSFLMKKLKSLKRIEKKGNGMKFYSCIQSLKKHKEPRLIKKILRTYSNLHAYLFGVKKLLDGAQHLQFLKELLIRFEDDKMILPESERNRLYESYSYIFGGEKRNIDYIALIKIA